MANADHFDTAIEKAKQSLAEARAKVEAGNWMAEAEVDALKVTLIDLEAEALIYRSKTPEQLAAEQAEREAYWEAFDKAAEAGSDEDENEEEDD